MHGHVQGGGDLVRDQHVGPGRQRPRDGDALTLATFSPNAAHERGLRRLDGKGIERLSTKELFYDWVRTIEAAEAFHDAHPGLAVPPGVRM
ncbi:hypothetical protein [Streptomyces sp. NRRL S-350]|uniref:hypothetical protein n=1 Tax=Streptomyces sp. NRRL S-350 TaxID=1463902 RepID=UPI000AF942CE|nr:hypothetical protein [Streptomyces sp. NRRL S-350]